MKIMIIEIFLLITCSTVYADNEKFNGYYWENVSYEEKLLLLTGYLSGYQSGLTLGIVDGVNSAYKTTKTIAEEIRDQKISRDFETCSKLIKNNVNIILKSSFANKKELLSDTREVTYYINEIDSFLKTYPLCKRKDVLYELFPQLTMVWLQTGTTTITYKDIGEECSKSK